MTRLPFAVLASSSDEDSAVFWIALVIAIGFGGWFYSWYLNNRAKQIRQRESVIRDRLTSEGLAPKVVAGALQVKTETDSKGNSRSKKISCVLALTEAHLIQFGLSDGDRTTVHLSDIGASSINSGEVTVNVMNGANLTYKPPLNRTEWTEGLTKLEQGLTENIGARKNPLGVSTQSIANELGRLAELRDEGVLDPDDWERAKDFYLGKREDERDRAARELRQLHELRKAGVLSASEFNTKKWEVLSRTR